MAMREFWLKWRHEIVRGGGIFVAVVALGLGVIWLVRNAKQQVESRITALAPALQGLHGLADNFDAPGRTHGFPVDWRGRLAAGQTLWIRNFNGPVELAPATGAEAVIHTERSWTGTDSAAVRVVFTPGPGGVTACAVMGDAGTCGPGGSFDTNVQGRHANVAVKFTVMVPRGVRVDANTMNGDVTGTGMHAPVDVKTINGDVTLTAEGGPVRARSTNGDVTVTVPALTDSVTLETINGDVTVKLPPAVSARLLADSKVGDVTSAFPLVMTPGTTARPGVGSHVESAIGAGGPLVRLQTIRGDINVAKLGTPSPPKAPVAPPAPSAVRVKPTTVRP